MTIRRICMALLVLGLAALLITAQEAGARKAPAEKPKKLLPKVPNIPYDPAKVLAAVKKKDKLPATEFYFCVWGDSKTAGMKVRNDRYATLMKTVLAMKPLPVIAHEVGDLVPGDGNDEKWWLGYENCANGMFRILRKSET